MSPTPNPQYWLNKKAHRKTGFPMATIAYYGPDDKFASKVVVGIVLREGDEPAFLERWFSDSADLRSDLSIVQRILDFHPGASR